MHLRIKRSGVRITQGALYFSSISRQLRKTIPLPTSEGAESGKHGVSSRTGFATTLTILQMVRAVRRLRHRLLLIISAFSPDHHALRFFVTDATGSG